MRGNGYEREHGGWKYSNERERVWWVQSLAMLKYVDKNEEHGDEFDVCKGWGDWLDSGRMQGYNGYEWGSRGGSNGEFDGAMVAGVSSSGWAASSTSDSVDFMIMGDSSAFWCFVDDLFVAALLQGVFPLSFQNENGIISLAAFTRGQLQKAPSCSFSLSPPTISARLGLFCQQHILPVSQKH